MQKRKLNWKLLPSCSFVFINYDFFCYSFRAADMWGLGCLIWEVFNGHLDESFSLKNTQKVSILFELSNYCISLFQYFDLEEGFLSLSLYFFLSFFYITVKDFKIHQVFSTRFYRAMVNQVYGCCDSCLMYSLVVYNLAI